MAFIKVNFQRGWIGSALKDYIAKVNGQAEEALDRIGLLFVSEIQRGFDQGGLIDPWPPTMQPNLPAIAQRLSDGKTIPDRYISGDKKPLIDSGMLRRSITHRASGSVLHIGTNLIYAPIHQLGLKSTVQSKIPDMIKEGNKTVERELKKLAKTYPKSANYLRKNSNITVKVRVRPFLVITDKMVRIAMAEMKNFLQKKWGEQTNA